MALTKSITDYLALADLWIINSSGAASVTDATLCKWDSTLPQTLQTQQDWRYK